METAGREEFYPEHGLEMDFGSQRSGGEMQVLPGQLPVEGMPRYSVHRRLPTARPRAFTRVSRDGSSRLVILARSLTASVKAPPH